MKTEITPPKKNEKKIEPFFPDTDDATDWLTRWSLETTSALIFGRSLGVMAKAEEEREEATTLGKAVLTAVLAEDNGGEEEDPMSSRKRLLRGSEAIFKQLRQWVLGPGNW